MRSRGAEDVWPLDEALRRGFDGFPLIEADDRAAGDIGFFNDWVRHSARDAYWQAIDGEHRTATLQAPALLMGGWFDPFLPGQLADFVRIRRDARPNVAAATRLVVGPWGHAETVALPGDIRNRNYRLESLAPSLPWFDRHLRSRDAGAASAAPVRLYVMGANVWRDERESPLARARETAWYQRGRGHANTASGDGRLTTEHPDQDDPPDAFNSDPASPVPTRGGAMLGGSATVPQNDVEARSDVIVYSTPPLAEDVEVTGPVSAVLHVATSSPSADFTAQLVDVHADGVAYNVSDGIVRRAYRPDVALAAATPAGNGLPSSHEATEDRRSLGGGGNTVPYHFATEIRSVCGRRAWSFEEDIESGWKSRAAIFRGLIAIRTPVSRVQPRAPSLRRPKWCIMDGRRHPGSCCH